MGSEKKLTLKEAREKNKLDQFINEHQNDTPGDQDRLDATIEKAVKIIEKKKVSRKNKD